MASVDLETKSEGASPVERASGPRISWDPTVVATAIGFGSDAEPTVLDWFGEGKSDLLVTAAGGNRGRTARIFRPVEGLGRGNYRYDAGTRVDSLDALRCLCPIPNGSASRFDLIGLAPEGWVWLPNSGTSQAPAFGHRRSLDLPRDLGIGPCRIVQVVADDWDGDGLVDLIVGIDDMTGYWPDGDRLPTAQQVGFNQKGGHLGYDRNGLWRGQAPSGRLFWLRNVGRPGAPEFALQPEIGLDGGPLELAPHPAAMTVAWGAGGSPELLVTDARGVVRIHRNFGGQRPPVLMEPRTLQCGHAPLLLPDDRTTVVAADIDSDRSAELVFGTSDGRVFAVHAGATRNDAKTPVPILHEATTVWLGGHAVLTTADLDGDGDLDLVVGDAPGRLLFFEDMGSGGDHRYAAPVVLEAGGTSFRLDPGPDGMRDGPVAPRLGYAAPALIDWTSNGRLDLIVGGAGGEVLFLRNDGAPNSPRFGSAVAIRCDNSPLITPPRVRPAAAEWNEPGQLDLIALDLQGFLCVYPRVGTVEVGPPVPVVDRLGRFLRLDGGFGQAGRCALWAGPWTQSGLVDVLVGIPRGNRHVVPALTGRPLESLDDVPTVLLLENLGHGRVAPRPVHYADGRPLIVGTDGCSPSGVDASGQGTLDLMIGADDGSVTLVRRDDLKW